MTILHLPVQLHHQVAPGVPVAAVLPAIDSPEAIELFSGEINVSGRFWI